MPYYDYQCDTCGPFTELGSMATFDQPCACPDCGASARRVLLQAPILANMDKARRTAFATNERAAHEPKSTRSHGPGCGCCSGKKKPSRTLHRPDGSKSFPTARPWMISH
ncbi:FmdB family zinc ribbon protein [Primorskyibacter sedentarius]|uniref:Putative FmdB family regulatory protein n=1 Tax=Primorskyibacter sedentarius TaxID=745311 RepID=A0A4R3J3P0_9RHOB|nr:zinc ribbon domain-containing protein [Primorskyibacter sedentarius]TCS59937.1 putative FmdB family regulatory protein [Primorskyibacter sedentarius]